MINYIKLSLIYLLIFLLLYFEPLQVMGIKWSHLWKVVVEYILIIIILFKLTQSSTTIWKESETLKWGLWYSLWPLVSSPLLENPLDGFFVVGQRVLPMILLYYLSFSLFSSEQLKRFFIHMIIFVVVSSIPFYFGLLEPLGKTYDLSDFAGEGTSLVGVFMTSHGASISYALAGLASLIFYLESPKGKSKIFWGIMTPILVFFMFSSMARAGYAAFAVGFLIYMVNYKKLKNYTQIIFIVASAVIVYVSLGMPSSSIFEMRLSGETVHHKESDLDTMSSGRLTMGLTALIIYKESGPIGWLIGVGQTGMKNKMAEKMGSPRVAHNGFISELVSYGIIGLFFLIRFFIAMFNDLKRIRNSTFLHIGMVFIPATLTNTFFQDFGSPLQIFPFIILIQYAYTHNVSIGMPGSIYRLNFTSRSNFKSITYLRSIQK